MTAHPHRRESVTVDGFPRRPWSAIPVDQVMRARVLTCGPETSLRDIARMMVTHAIHAVVVVDRDERDGEFMIGVVDDRRLTLAAVEGREPVARELCDPQATTVSLGWTLEQAARELLRTGGGHAVVIDGRGGPIGMLSTLDLARIAAWGHV